MATFKICVFEHQKREDNKYPISIRVTSNRKVAYINTGNYVVRGQIAKDFKTIKDSTVVRAIDSTIQKYEEIIIKKLGADVKSYSAKELCAFLKLHSTEQCSIDFVAFARSHIGKMLADNRTAYGKLMDTTLNAMIDYFGRDEIYIREITSKSLTGFAAYLQTERTMMRKDRDGKLQPSTRKGVSDRTLSDYMTNIRTLFNAAMDAYNDSEMDVMLITHYPFRKFKINTNHESKKRNLSTAQIRLIAGVDDIADDLRAKRLSLARDVFMLSFYLVGMNLADLYYADDYSDGRISYNRRKTSGRRSDNAFISIKVEPEAIPLIEKYRDKSGGRIFSFYKMYVGHSDFMKNVNAGLKQIASTVGLDVALTSYYARHSWATIARNDCAVSKDDINLALNHVDANMKVTDIYLAKDWTAIDRANRAVIDYLNTHNSPVNEDIKTDLANMLE